MRKADSLPIKKISYKINHVLSQNVEKTNECSFLYLTNLAPCIALGHKLKRNNITSYNAAKSQTKHQYISMTVFTRLPGFSTEPICL